MRQASDEEHELERQKPGVKAAETTESQEQSNKVGQSQQPLLGRLPALVAAVIIVGVAIGAAAGLLTLMLYVIEHLALGYVESTHESGPFNVPCDFRHRRRERRRHHLVAAAHTQHKGAVRQKSRKW